MMEDFNGINILALVFIKFLEDIVFENDRLQALGNTNIGQKWSWYWLLAVES